MQLYQTWTVEITAILGSETENDENLGEIRCDLDDMNPNI